MTTECSAGRLTFCRFDERFLEKSRLWLTDPEVKRLTMTPDFTAEDQARWFARLASMRDYLIWGLMCDAVPVGAMGLKHVTQMQAEYWGYLGDRQYWGLGLGQEMVRFGLTQARKLGLAELYLKVHQDNTRAIRLYTKAGFRPTAQLGAVLEMRRPVADSHE